MSMVSYDSVVVTSTNYLFYAQTFVTKVKDKCRCGCPAYFAQSKLADEPTAEGKYHGCEYLSVAKIKRA
jgi:hypothetical protein